MRSFAIVAQSESLGTTSQSDSLGAFTASAKNGVHRLVTGPRRQPGNRYRVDDLAATAPSAKVSELRVSEQLRQTRSEVGQLQVASESSVQIIGCSAAGVCPRHSHSRSPAARSHRPRCLCVAGYRHMPASKRQGGVGARGGIECLPEIRADRCVAACAVMRHALVPALRRAPGP